MLYNTKTQAKEMSILSIESINLSEDYVTVTAVIEDVVLTYAGSYYDPPEYGPARCSSTFELGEDETLPTDENELLKYIESRDLYWEVMEDDDYNYDDYA
jgi:hypothetical protein